MDAGRLLRDLLSLLLGFAIHITCQAAAGSGFLKTSAGIVAITAGAPGADLRAVVVAAVALGASPGPGVPSCSVFPPMQYLRLQSVALREVSKTRQQGRTSTLWGLIDRSTSEPRGQRQDHFEAFLAGVMSVRPQKIENFSTHQPNLSKYYMKSIPNFHSIGAE